MRNWLLAIALGAIAAGQARAFQSAPTTSAVTSGSDAATAHTATLNRYCVTCHNDKLKTAELSLEKLDISNISAASLEQRALLEKVTVSWRCVEASGSR